MKPFPKNQTIHCFKPGVIETIDIPYPDYKEGEIIVKSIYTGICRTDVDIFEGKADPLPFGMFGHEGFGVVYESFTPEISVGKYVATRSDMAYAKYYRATLNDIRPYTRDIIPSPKYILEPLACAKNIMHYAFQQYSSSDKRLILGTGFLARSVRYYMEQYNNYTPVDMLSNRHQIDGAISLDECDWSKYKVIVDCSGNIQIPIEKLQDNTHLVMASKLQYSFETDFSKYLWKAIKMDFPSPRSESFSMRGCTIPGFAESEWTHTDSFENAQALFEASVKRGENFRRSYISYE